MTATADRLDFKALLFDTEVAAALLRGTLK